ncbi:hypothetical protein Tco_1371114 [Tanacetum coccineum]
MYMGVEKMDGGEGWWQGPLLEGWGQGAREGSAASEEGSVSRGIGSVGEGGHGWMWCAAAEEANGGRVLEGYGGVQLCLGCVGVLNCHGVDNWIIEYIKGWGFDTSCLESIKEICCTQQTRSRIGLFDEHRGEYLSRETSVASECTGGWRQIVQIAYTPHSHHSLECISAIHASLSHAVELTDDY